MENKQTSTRASFKAYPKTEQIREDYTKVNQFKLKGSRIIHHIDYKYNIQNKSVFLADSDRNVNSKKFFKPLEKLKLIQALNLKIYQYRAGTLFKDFSEKLRPLSSLEDLNLQFRDLYWLKANHMVHVADAFGDLKRLSKLTLNFSCCSELDDKCFDILFRSLKKNRGLRSFDLDISSCITTTEKTFETLASFLQYASKSLEELSLKLGNFIIPGSALDLLVPGLESLTHLQKLRIPMLAFRFPQNEDSDAFLSSIYNLESLRELSLNLSTLPADMITLENLCSTLESLTELRSLSLNLMNSEKPFSLQEMEMLTQSFQSFRSLEFLTLDFRKSCGIEHKAFENLSAALEKLTDLSEIRLSFEQCPQVGDAKIESLIARLEKLPNLNFVNFSFKNCPRIKHEHYNRLHLVKNIEGECFTVEKTEFSG